LEATALVDVGNEKGNIHAFKLHDESEPATCPSSKLV
jgi:hypothetical protein